MYDKFISTQEPQDPRYCAGCHNELHAPFLMCIAEKSSPLDPPDEEWFCSECSEDDEAWTRHIATEAGDTEFEWGGKESYGG